MTQDPTRRSYKRSVRAGRNKPLLVTSPESEELESGADSLPTLEESLAEVQAQNPPLPDTTRAPRRFAGFISNVGKKAPTDAVPEVDATSARLARATRSKGFKSTTDTPAKSEPKAVAKKEPARASTRPASPFKTKYFIGMALYLLGANIVGIGVTTFFTNNHLDSTLAQFNLFGGLIVIKTSTLVFLAILVILLVLLARFDLIPRSFSAMSGTPPKRTTSTSKSTQNTFDGGRSIPPTMKQGVKGKDDDLYQEYRSNLRRDRRK